MALPIDPKVISNEAIDDLAVRYPSLDLTDASSRGFMQSLSSGDVQAAPGCGKTTLTAMKLCLLSDGWLRSDQGLCVLTHTNVAKDQIIELLQGDRSGSKLLEYPHFIGTIQTFVHNFLAFPLIRSLGIDVSVVDDGFYEIRAERAVTRSWSYPNLKGVAKRKPDVAGAIGKGTYFFETNSMVLRCPDGKPFPVGDHTASFKEWEKLKNDLTKDGVFRYADMFAYAQLCLKKCGWIAESIRSRFPLLIVDEAQDVSIVQERVIDSVFGSASSVVQRIGDSNQRLHATDPAEFSGCTFPKPGFLQLPLSRRLPKIIADSASNLTIQSPQVIQGNARTAPPITVFLIDESSAESVVDKFKEHVGKIIGAFPNNKNLPIKIIGARLKNEGKSFPKDIRSYVPNHERSRTSGDRPVLLWEAIAKARSLIGSPTLADTYSAIQGAFVKYLRVAGAKKCGARPTKGEFSKWLEQNEDAHETIRGISWQLVSVPGKELAKSWTSVCEQLHKTLLDGEKSINSGELKAFVALPSDPTFSGADLSSCDGKSPTELSVDVDTVHGVKGETHYATLIVECNSRRVSDLKEVLPFLVGKGQSARLKGPTVKDAMTSIFVGMTRPTTVLCFAIHKDHVQDIKDFESFGWHVIDLT